MNSIVVHYQEIALKGRNRPWFVARLAAEPAGGDVPTSTCSKVRVLMGRIEIVLGPTATFEQVGERLAARVRRRQLRQGRPRPASTSTRSRRPSWPTSAIATPRSFRVSARRADKRFPLTSPEIEREVGGRIKQARGWRVDSGAPRARRSASSSCSDEAFYSFGKERGPGGLPTGVSGRVACLMSGGIDSPVAAYRMMKRGCSVRLVHFHSHPFRLARLAGEGARDRRAADAVPAPDAAATSWRSASFSAQIVLVGARRRCASCSTGA